VNFQPSRSSRCAASRAAGALSSGRPASPASSVTYSRRRWWRRAGSPRTWRQRRQLFLDFLEARLLLVRQFGAGQAEVAHFVVEDALACRRQGGEFGLSCSARYFCEQRQVLAERL
jgi:hypothetical protein